MKLIIYSLILILSTSIYSQTINLNQSNLEDYIRRLQLNNEINNDLSFTIRPLNIGKNGYDIKNLSFDFSKSIYESNKIKFKILPIEFNTSYNSKYPYNRNNGSMIPNRGIQQIISFGLYTEIGPLSIQLKPEYLFAENKRYDGFWEGHYDVIWSDRYDGWNQIDTPERFGNEKYEKFLFGQSSIRLNFKSLSFGFSTENLWWGPSIRNSIMMSNHARGFKHLTFNTNKPINTIIGNIEWQLVSGRLEPSGYNPPNTERTYRGVPIYIPKINQMGRENDWRYFQGYVITISPKFLDGFSLGIIRWAQMYSALVKGEYYWMEGKTTYFPLFSNLLRKRDSSADLEPQIDQAGGIFFRWLWKDSRAEIYSEFHYNDAKWNIRDLILDSDHSRGVTVGLQKLFKINSKKYEDILFSWEWTQLEQTSSRLIRNAGSWYQHYNVYHGFTNYGEVIGAGIGPGSNSNFFSVSLINDIEKIGFSFEIIDQDNDFYYRAYENSNDFRRYWKDLNFHLTFDKKLNNFLISSNLVFVRSLNYQWQLEEKIGDYYQNGKDTNNLHITLKLSYFL